MKRHFFLSEWLLYRGISQTKLSKISGITQGQISRILTGKSVPRISTLKIFANVLEAGSVAALFNDPFEPSNVAAISITPHAEPGAAAEPTEAIKGSDELPPKIMEGVKRLWHEHSAESQSNSTSDLADWLSSPDATIYGKEATPEMKAHIKSLIEMVMKEK